MIQELLFLLLNQAWSKGQSPNRFCLQRYPNTTLNYYSAVVIIKFTIGYAQPKHQTHSNHPTAYRLEESG